LKWVERCLVSPSFWQGIEEGDVRIDDLKKAISKWVVTRSSTGQSKGPEPMYLPGKVTATIAPDQSMDANVKMHPFGSKRRSELRAQQAGIDPDVDLLDLEPKWRDNYPKFTNFLDDEKLHNEELATLGNSILGMLGSEWLDRRYPYLPTKSAPYSNHLIRYFSSYASTANPVVLCIIFFSTQGLSGCPYNVCGPSDMRRCRKTLGSFIRNRPLKPDD
jgi:hypothetical protein